MSWARRYLPRRVSGQPWRRRLALWLPALIFFLLALAPLLVFPLRFAGRAEVTQEELAEARRELAALEAESSRVQARARDLATTGADIEGFYDERLASERARLTRIIAEVKTLASRSGLEPRQISYPSEALEEYGLRKRSFAFSVEGSYAELRTFINLLELSDSFLTLERVSLSNRSAGQLGIQLTLSTLFATEDGSPLEET